MLDWIITNKEWLFSGIGGVIITILVGVFMRSGNQLKQSQKSGDNSNNYQAGTSITVEHKDNDK
ncbi:hypothetical protein [Aeromonas sp. s4]|uniref:hypothetical protein n=1 Tax=Aeromonas sp. s4 TaxID=3138486 RepID=UPI0034A18247